jgi:hypothetical protein
MELGLHQREVAEGSTVSAKEMMISAMNRFALRAIVGIGFDTGQVKAVAKKE